MIKRCSNCCHEKTAFLDAPCFQCGPDHPHWTPKPFAETEPAAAVNEEIALPPINNKWKAKTSEIIMDLVSLQMLYPLLSAEWIAINTTISDMYTVKKLIEAKEEGK